MAKTTTTYDNQGQVTGRTTVKRGSGVIGVLFWTVVLLEAASPHSFTEGGGNGGSTR